MSGAQILTPVYTSHGDLGAIRSGLYIFSPTGEWIGWMTPQKRVYSVHGHFVGHLDREGRIVRSRSDTYGQERLKSPEPPPPITPPDHFPLAPMMSELALGTIDILDEEPWLLPPVDFGELQDDMD